MLDFLVVLSTFGIVGTVVALIVAAVRQKTKRVFAVGIVVFAIVFIISIAIYPREESDEYELPSEGNGYAYAYEGSDIAHEHSAEYVE